MIQKDAEIIGIWGGRGSGKSTQAKEKVKHEKRVIAVDPLGDWTSEGFTEYQSHAALYKAIKRNWARGFRVSLNIGKMPDPVRALHKLSCDLFVIQQPYKDRRDPRKIILVVDEMSITVPNRTLSGDERGFLNLCNLGRHWGVGIIGISQRMAQVHKDFTGNTSEDYFFRLGEAVDVARALQKMGSEYKGQLRALQTHEYLKFRAGTVTKGINLLAKRPTYRVQKR